MLIKQGVPPTFVVYTTATLNPPNTYTVYKAGSAPILGVGAVTNPPYNTLKVALDTTEVDTLGDLLILFFDSFGFPIVSISHQVVAFDPNDGAALGLTKLSAIVADPWSTPVPGAYPAGQAGYVLGHLTSAGDPWATPVPGAYPAGQAGYVLGHLAAAAASSVLSTPNSVDTGLTLVQAVKLITAVLCGVSAVAGFNVTFFDTTDTISRVVATLDGTGQRTAVVYDLS